MQGDTEATVEPGLDLVPGDEVYFAPTALIHSAFDYLTVLSYDDATGVLTLTSEFKHYHFGADDTTADYQGLDMRGEVGILSRNIVIKGDGAVFV